MKHFFPVRFALCAVLIGCLANMATADGTTDIKTITKTLRIAVPPAGLLAPPVLKLNENRVLEEQGIQIEIVSWTSPDQLRALIVSGKVDLVGLHVGTAALFDSKGLPIKFLGASLGNVLYIMSNEAPVVGLDSLKGKAIAVPMRGEYPDILLRVVLDKLALSESISLQYTATSRDAANQLSSGAVDAALIAEPHASILSLRMGQTLESIQVYRAVDMQKAWNQANGMSLPLVTAGLAALGDCSSDLELLDAFWIAYVEANKWCLDHPEEAIVLLGDALKDKIARQGAVVAFKSSACPVVASGAERKQIESYLDIMGRASVKESGVHIPGDDFYWTPSVDGEQ